MSGRFLPGLELFTPIITVDLCVSFSGVLLNSVSNVRRTNCFRCTSGVTEVPLAVIATLYAIVLPRVATGLTTNRESRTIKVLKGSV